MSHLCDLRHVALLLLAISATPVLAADKPRLLVLTDIGGDPDDQQSLIRLMHYAHAFDIEGLIASASGTPGELGEAVVKPHLIRAIVEAYGQVRDNLLLHQPGYPSAAALSARIKSGNPRRGLDHIGPGEDTEGSDWIITVVDKPDPRPVNVTIWGGQTDLAQALWRVRRDRSALQLQRFLAKLRVYDIADQDGLQPWLLEQFPGLFYILNHRYPDRDKRTACFRGMYLGGDESLTSRPWIDRHVRNHGPLGALYPDKTWTAPNPHGALKEGDTPSWFFFLPNGLNRPDHPEYGGWGGRFLRQGRGLYRDAQDRWEGPDQAGWQWDRDNSQENARATVYRWRSDFQNDFQARLDWGLRPFDQANHPPQGLIVSVAKQSLAEGDQVELAAEGVTDPDGDMLNYRWTRYREAETCAADIVLLQAASSKVTVRVERVTGPGTAHVILRVNDGGTPPLCCYRRVILNIIQ